MSEERIAALEQRVGALVEALCGWVNASDPIGIAEMRTRLAALRAPGVAACAGDAKTPDERVAELEAVAETMREERRVLISQRDALRVEVDSMREGRARDVQQRDTARRERDEAVADATERATNALDLRDEAVAVLGDWLTWRDKLNRSDGDNGSTLHRIIVRARALVAGQGVDPAPEQVRERLTGFRSDWAELSSEQREKFRAYDGPLNGGAATTPDRCGSCRHRPHEPGRCINQDSDGDCPCGADLAARDAEIAGLRARVAELEARDREGRELLEFPEDNAWHERVAAYLSAAPIPDPARRLIERAVKLVLAANGDDGYPIEDGQSFVEAASAYLGGGT